MESNDKQFLKGSLISLTGAALLSFGIQADPLQIGIIYGVTFLSLFIVGKASQKF